MTDQLTTDDKTLLAEIMDTMEPEQLAQRLFAYYHDSNRAERTSRAQMYLHLGMLTGAIMRAVDGRRMGVVRPPSVGWSEKREKSE